MNVSPLGHDCFAQRSKRNATYGCRDNKKSLYEGYTILCAILTYLRSVAVKYLKDERNGTFSAANAYWPGARSRLTINSNAGTRPY